jgi:hypothetical protein
LLLGAKFKHRKASIGVFSDLCSVEQVEDAQWASYPVALLPTIEKTLDLLTFGHYITD